MLDFCILLLLFFRFSQNTSGRHLWVLNIGFIWSLLSGIIDASKLSVILRSGTIGIFVSCPDCGNLFYRRFQEPFDIVQLDINSFEALAISTLVSKFLEGKVDLELLTDILGDNSTIT